MKMKTFKSEEGEYNDSAHGKETGKWIYWYENSKFII